MRDYSVNLIVQSIWSISKVFFDIGIMWFLLYYVLKIIKNNSRTIQIFKGILVVVIVDAVAKLLGFTTVSYFAGMFINWGFLAVIIIFQPEIRGILEKVGKTNTFSKFNVLLNNEKEKLAQEVYETAIILSQSRVGAIISIEQSQSMQDYIKTGIILNSEVNTALLTSIFMTTTPLHDGAVIIQGNKVACASAYFPPTSLQLPNRYGARHRAALGISEVSDAVTVVVSEETSEISIAEKGKMFHVDPQQLKDYLLRVICKQEIEIKNKRQRFNIMIGDEPEIVIEKEDDAKVGFFRKFFKKNKKKENEVKEEKPLDVSYDKEKVEQKIEQEQKVENKLDEMLNHDIKIPYNNRLKFEREKEKTTSDVVDDVISIEDNSDKGGE